MGRVLTNATGLSYALESSLATLPGSPTWKAIEPNEIPAFGAEITTVPRRPISKSRQRRKGATTDLDSSVEVNADLTMESFLDFIQSFLFAAAKYPSSQSPIRSGALYLNLAADNDPPPAGTDPGFTHSALSAAIPTGRLVYSRGFTNAVNNGLFQVKTGSTTTATLVEGTPAFVDEIPSNEANATLEIAGVRGATGDIQVNAGGNLISTVLDFTTLGLVVGQVIHVGGLLTANRFAIAANFGYARVRAIATNLLTLDKKATTFTTDNGSGKQIDLLFSGFVRNVAVDHADYRENSFHFEAAFPNLDVPGPGARYEYAKGNFANELNINLPLTDKAGLEFRFVGTDTEVPTTSRKTNAANAALPVQTTAFSTASDIARLRVTKVDETGLTTDFKSLTATLNNNVTREKVLGVLGARYMNAGLFEVDVETQIVFTDSRVIEAVRNNETLTMDWSIRNGDGGVFFDIPSLTLEGGGRDFEVDASVLASFTIQSFGDPVLGYSIGVSLFAFVPAS